MEWTKKDLKLLKDRDSAAFKRLYEQYKKSIYNFLYLKTKGNVEIAKEITCETFYSALKTVDKIKNTKNLKGWLLQIAARRLYDYFQKENLIDKYQEYFISDSMNEVNMEDKILKEEITVMVNMALNNLKSDYSKILSLKYIKKKSQKEISEIMNKSESGVESMLVRARKELKKELQKNKGFFYEN